MAYVIRLMSCPVVSVWLTIILAPNQETRIRQAYIQNCISGILNASRFSALEKSR